MMGPDFLEERMEMYEVWIYTAKVRDVHTFRYGDQLTPL